MDAKSVAFPALGTGVGGFPLEEAARVMISAVRDELERSPGIEHVIFALRGAAAYEAFSASMALTVANASGGGAR
jgi:O-acetyl-ADP-ribose deacetylase (regulator of RNase III)